MKTTVQHLNGDTFTFEDGSRPQTDEKLTDTHDPAPCGCQSCGGRAVPEDDLETRRKIERYRNKHYG